MKHMQGKSGGPGPPGPCARPAWHQKGPGSCLAASWQPPSPASTASPGLRKWESLGLRARAVQPTNQNAEL